MSKNSEDKSIITYLVELYLYGKQVHNSKYNQIIKDILAKIKNIIEPCTLITYSTYLELLRKLFPRGKISDSLLRALLLNINDNTAAFTEQEANITVYG